MGAGAGLYMYDVVVKSSRSLSHLLMSSYVRLLRFTLDDFNQRLVGHVRDFFQ